MKFKNGAECLRCMLRVFVASLKWNDLLSFFASVPIFDALLFLMARLTYFGSTMEHHIFGQFWHFYKFVCSFLRVAFFMFLFFGIAS